MDNGEVSLLEFKQELVKSFHYAVITWNSGNFYTIVASNSKKNIEKFISYMS